MLVRAVFALSLSVAVAPLGAQSPPHRDPPRVEIFADGSIKDMLGGGSEGALATGALGLRYRGPLFRTVGMINVAGTSDTIASNYGASLLAPGAGAGLNAGLVEVRMAAQGLEGCQAVTGALVLPCNLGLHAYASASTRIWGTNVERSTDASGETRTRVLDAMEVPIWGLGLALTYTFFDDVMQGEESSWPVAMALDVGYARRAIRGNLASDRPTRRALRSVLLLTEDTDFGGLEIRLGLRYKDVLSSFTYYRMRGDIDGFSGGQILAVVSLQAVLNSGLLRRDP